MHRSDDSTAYIICKHHNEASFLHSSQFACQTWHIHIWQSEALDPNTSKYARVGDEDLRFNSRQLTSSSSWFVTCLDSSTCACIAHSRVHFPEMGTSCPSLRHEADAVLYKPDLGGMSSVIGVAAAALGLSCQQSAGCQPPFPCGYWGRIISNSSCLRRPIL